jgi:two-component system, cell cycle sensor histidine kinase and response regulator CckA
MGMILIVDDKQENLYLLEVLLRGNGFDIMSASDGREALDKARNSPPDMIVSDILMPVMDGFTLCREWKADETLGKIPFIFYTATYTGQKDIDFGLSLGAERFLIKPLDPEALLTVIREVLSEAELKRPETRFFHSNKELDILKQYNEVLFHKLQDKIAALETSNSKLQQEIEKRRLIEENLRQSEERLRIVLNSLPVGLAWGKKDDKIEYVNKTFTELFGYIVEDLPSINILFRLAFTEPQKRDQLYTLWVKSIEEAKKTGMPTQPFDVRITCKDGTFRDVSVIGTVILDFHIAVLADITEKTRLQEHLTRAQKMESIGNLAGGIAHDFNNILTVVTGLAGLLQMNMSDSDPLIRYVNEIASAGMRGASLTKQLLAFSRKQILEVKPVDLNEITTDLKKMLHRLIREDITLTFALFAGPLPITADPTQIEQVIINIVTNARDAMPNGGPLRISTEKVFIDDSFIRQHDGGEAGNYAVINISDKGIGMDADTKVKIFEPFYTTKEIGKGTGLGLAVVYGIVQQHKGMICVESEPGKGSSFSVYLPSLKGDMEIVDSPHSAIDYKGGSETILLAEDNPMIRDMINDILQRHGYNVITAKSGDVAVNLFMEQSKIIDMIILDLMMPGKKGFDVYMEIIKEPTKPKVLFITGYSESEVEQQEIRKRSLPLLLKPFTLVDLLKKIRELLDKGDSPIYDISG